MKVKMNMIVKMNMMEIKPFETEKKEGHLIEETIKWNSTTIVQDMINMKIIP
jgi:hypothetical protein